MTPKTQSVCKWCQSLEHTEENCRFRPIKAVVTVANGEPVAEPASTGEPPECKEFVAHLIAGASWFICALPKGHKEEGHRAAGKCFKHGFYLGEPSSVPQCPQWPDCARAARPSGPSAPHCPECKTQLRDETAWYRCDTCHARYSSSMERGLYRLPDDRSSAPQTSAEPYIGSDQERVFLEKKALGDFAAAPQPVPRADDPEHPIVGPEDGFPCCKHCAKHPGSQWTLKVSQPVSGDAPKVEERYTCNPKPLNGQHWTGCQEGKVEEVARKIEDAVISDVLQWRGNSQEEKLKRLENIAAVLRPYFPQTPDKITNDLCEIGRRVLNCLEKHRCPDGAIDEIESSMANLDRVIRKLRSSEPATPASTAREQKDKNDN